MLTTYYSVLFDSEIQLLWLVLNHIREFLDRTKGGKGGRSQSFNY